MRSLVVSFSFSINHLRKLYYSFSKITASLSVASETSQSLLSPGMPGSSSVIFDDIHGKAAG